MQATKSSRPHTDRVLNEVVYDPLLIIKKHQHFSLGVVV